MFDQISRRPISMKIDYLPLIDEYFIILPMNMIVDDDMLYSYDAREMIFDHIWRFHRIRFDSEILKKCKDEIKPIF